jgi:hypothetical protein
MAIASSGSGQQAPTQSMKQAAKEVRIDPVHHDAEPTRPAGTPQSKGRKLRELEMGLSPVGDGVEIVTIGDPGPTHKSGISFSL